MTTHELEVPGATLTYDVHGSLPTADGRPPLLMTGLPMAADGFTALAAHFPERTVVTYDPRGLGRSVRTDGEVDNVPAVHAADVHAVIEALGAGPVELFASSGGAIVALALVTAHPADVTTLVAHEPPLLTALPDAEAAARAADGYRAAYAAKGFGAGMAAFIAMTSWQGEFTDEYFAAPTTDPAMFGLPVEDDGSRDDPLLSERSRPVLAYRADIAALTGAPTRIVLGFGEESRGTVTERTSTAIAGLLGHEPVLFPSHHGGFTGPESGYPGEPEAFAHVLHGVLDGNA
ncbi:alpha/beta fold hydrolase [Nocardia asteroides]|uniref:alpha/beta fold hydrolase n=1 Tax=Nocardia asteroides TaxID=1824 RepID=UPI001E61D43F|nr:alpha/beta hydrolase [Nocardia asteroides]UGT55704.1 alpha/beta hydrolase [Nocardia asteroides]